MKRLYLNRAGNELELAKIIFKITKSKALQEDVFSIKTLLTFYSAVISHSYYCMFYSVKSNLFEKEIKIIAPNEHKKAYEEFKKFVNSGELGVELLKKYEKIITKAEKLLSLFKLEKKKMESYTYQKLSQANEEPAEESLRNADEFFRQIYFITY